MGRFVFLPWVPQIKSAPRFGIQKIMSPNSSPDVLLHDLDKLLNLRAALPHLRNGLRLVPGGHWAQGAPAVTGWVRAVVPMPLAWALLHTVGSHHPPRVPAHSALQPPPPWVPSGVGCCVLAQSTSGRLSVGKETFVPARG